VRHKRLGRTNLEVSALSLGTVELGLDYGIANGGEARRPSESEARDLLHFALDRGINLIDTARAYGDAERIIGRALKERRHEYVLISKILPKSGLPAEVVSQVETSLATLQTDHIDVMMIHCRAEQTLPDEETFEELDKLRQAGKIRFIGSSVYGPDAAMASVSCGWFDCIEVGYSLLDRRIESAMLPLAESNDVGVIARSVLLKGSLTERYLLLPETLNPLKDCIRQLARLTGSASRLPEFAYRYVSSRPLPHSALIGTASRAEIDACIGYLELGSLAPEEIRAVQSVRLDDERWLNPGNWPSL
jgi:aryl-alcohol dehydrogenase-like predicted oxidoreductase